MINLSIPKDEHELKPRITVIGIGGAGGNARLKLVLVYRDAEIDHSVPLRAC